MPQGQQIVNLDVNSLRLRHLVKYLPPASQSNSGVHTAGCALRAASTCAGSTSNAHLLASPPLTLTSLSSAPHYRPIRLELIQGRTSEIFLLQIDSAMGWIHEFGCIWDEILVAGSVDCKYEYSGLVHMGMSVSEA